MFSAASTLWLVPSPRWLTLRGRRAEASAAWDLLEVGQAEREKAEDEQSRGAIVLEQMQGPAAADTTTPTTTTTTIIVDASNGEGDVAAVPLRSSTQDPDTSGKHGFFSVFARDVRTRTALAVFLMGMQQLSGIDGVLYVRDPVLYTLGFILT